ncbi:Putative methyltransferase YcgJ [Sphingomonas antarctica]|uniref:ArsR/SmtB family transcription factor n=1 Tax=Sphingomonas antarctica TaxID=2040274 RepID=UPI0039E8D034
MRLVDTLTDLFRALADPTRLRIVALLGQMELAVGELAQVLEQSQPRVSRHVKILCDAGLACRRREGSWVFLTPGDATIAEPLEALIHAAGGAELGREDIAHLAAIRAERTAAAERFFAQHAHEWDALRSLHAPDDSVEARMRAMLSGPLGQLVDLGTGTGRMIELFSAQASRATGIDRSPEMLRLARAKLDGQPCDLRQGEIAALPLNDAVADTVIVHQVLHYLSEPAVAIGEAARILAPGGRLLIADFASHEHEELRDGAAHARLGFEDAQIAGWLADAGLTLDATETLEGGTLTVKLWRAAKPALARKLAA